MPKGKERNCRFCLDILDDDYNVIEENIREIFEVLLLKVDLSVSKEPLICKSCKECIQEAFNFKSTFISVNKQVISLAVDRNSGELDIRDVYLSENETKNCVFNKDYNICRFCLQCLEQSNFNLLSDLKEDFADEMLLKCIPELDLNIIKDPVICSSCMMSLKSYYSFALKCQDTEKKIMKYCGIQGVECSGQISLTNVLKFMFQDTLKHTGNCDKTDAVKEEDNLCQNKGDTYSDINNMLKIEEELIIKGENTDWDCSTEENSCSKTKSKEYHTPVHRGNSKMSMYKCNLCNHESKRKSYLIIHMLTHKDSSEVVMYRCEMCTFETKYKSSLKNHMLIHKDNSKGTVYKCNICSYETKIKINLTKHMLTHKDSSDVVMYGCEICTYKTKRKYYLKIHTLVHKDNSELTMYKCHLCSYESKWQRALRRHMLIHKNSADVEMYGCKTCTYKTRSKDCLKNHMRIHKDNSELTTYKCYLCGYESKWKKTLRRHIHRIHKNFSDVVIHRC